MNQLTILGNNILTMSSLEIAEMVQSGYLTHGEYRYESKSTGAEKLVAKLAKDCVGE